MLIVEPRIIGKLSANHPNRRNLFSHVSWHSVVVLLTLCIPIFVYQDLPWRLPLRQLYVTAVIICGYLAVSLITLAARYRGTVLTPRETILANLAMLAVVYLSFFAALPNNVIISKAVILATFALLIFSVALDVSPHPVKRIAMFGLTTTLLACGVMGFDGDAAKSRAVFEYAKAMAMPVIVANPAPGSFDILDGLCAEFGIRIAIHNHGPEDEHSSARPQTPPGCMRSSRSRGPHPH